MSFDELALKDRFRVFWGFIWRALLTTLASAVGGAIAGFILGFALGLAGHVLGWSIDAVRVGSSILGAVAGLAVGLLMFWLYIRWLFRADWFGYRLRLVR